jgi:hypothetical protein
MAPWLPIEGEDTVFMIGGKRNGGLADLLEVLDRAGESGAAAGIGEEERGERTRDEKDGDDGSKLDDRERARQWGT